MNFLKPPLHNAVQNSASSKKSSKSNQLNYNSPMRNENNYNISNYNNYQSCQKFSNQSQNSQKCLNITDLKNMGWDKCFQKNNNYQSSDEQSNGSQNSAYNKMKNICRFDYSYEKRSPYKVGFGIQKTNPFEEEIWISPSIDGKKENNYQSPVKNNYRQGRVPFQVLYDESQEKEDDDELNQGYQSLDEENVDNNNSNNNQMEEENDNDGQQQIAQNKNYYQHQLKYQNLPFSIKLQKVNQDSKKPGNKLSKTLRF